jgi:plastocyanin
LKHRPVVLKLDSGGNIVTDPSPVIVDPGDTVDWECREGDVTVSFKGLGLFDGPETFQGRKGEKTPKGRVRADVARNRHFDCTITLNGKVLNKVYGIDTSGSGG